MVECLSMWLLEEGGKIEKEKERAKKVSMFVQQRHICVKFQNSKNLAKPRVCKSRSLPTNEARSYKTVQ